ncbi:MAG: glucans biosynthesis glucosyltransferase MdoH [Candidatus Hydrogenedentes bacterium]|nr:glucans biosynthesis glucosyltransferase MdoH [Candidatus Hydrogenedentota bacterium]
MRDRHGNRVAFTILLSLAALTTAAATRVFAHLILTNGWDWVDIPLIVLFLVLFLWISIAFWTATFGCAISLFRRDHPLMPSPPPERGQTGVPLPRTAIVMPIYNEEPRRVFAGLRAISESLQETGLAESFDLFVLSDTTNPDIWAEEESAWARLRCTMAADCGLYYRRRAENRERKAGNIRDFCERWGGHYEYMVVLDADSLMTGATLVELVRRMQEDPEVGILQVSRTLVNRSSFFARVLQFSSALYGNIFSSGFAFWSQTEGNYWGHNAIIRLRAFTQCCGLPKLPGRPPWGGEILSHDFVEAAFMLRAGWKVVVASDLGGSYEECPATLIDFAKRDERWSQGNLQHLPLTVARGMNPMGRFHMGMGAMSYVASPLWALFMMLSVVEGVGLAISTGTFEARFTDGNLPIGVALLPLTSALTLLLMVKVWGYLGAACRPSIARRFGGAGRLALSVLLETVASVFVAPILMAFHTTFVINSLLGRKVAWEAQARDESAVRFHEAYRVHSMHTIVGLAAALILAWRASVIFWWMLPILVGLVLSVPLSLLLSSTRVGRWLRKMGLLLIPEEIEVPPIVARQQMLIAEETAQSEPALHPFVRLVIDPALLGVHLATLPDGASQSVLSPAQKERLLQIALAGGPWRTTREERLSLLNDREALYWLHREAWKSWPLDVLQKVATAQSSAVSFDRA